jgi:hypothetical protein
MKKWIYFVLVVIVGLAVFVLLSWSFGNGSVVNTLEIAYSSGPLPPEYYNKADMTIKPDYALRTISVDYVSEGPYEDGSIDGNSFKGSATMGGEYFDRFEEVVEVLSQRVEDSKSNDCDGGSSLGILARGLNGKDDAFLITSCLQAGDPARIVKPFYDDVVTLLTRTKD